MINDEQRRLCPLSYVLVYQRLKSKFHAIGAIGFEQGKSAKSLNTFFTLRQCERSQMTKIKQAV
jgi:hypothetical protein